MLLERKDIACKIVNFYRQPTPWRKIMGNGWWTTLAGGKEMSTCLPACGRVTDAVPGPLSLSGCTGFDPRKPPLHSLHLLYPPFWLCTDILSSSPTPGLSQSWSFLSSALALLHFALKINNTLYVYMIVSAVSNSGSIYSLPSCTKTIKWRRAEIIVSSPRWWGWQDPRRRGRQDEW